mmetsp:Transcript_26429/g.39075  ORF Transcript_26429/g.39075 Transcript_26429/m.39075 type:complete len:971 (+) Transcript_26429:72-2984(+)|eukprot:CAMPEP_0194206568 /NCGR_PEP_ID=MMETSP0156-20130528/5549_1 /TAXON_ID=33649 /ORGANISM="Thalassionema nitzschioides, Strain L26-B" /LENGTH=970 /DNA_ID=CAMNT_0038933115 /DNA_START=37 /DNA_END=2949 /DNA_ORIENTATION=+
MSLQRLMGPLGRNENLFSNAEIEKRGKKIDNLDWMIEVSSNWVEKIWMDDPSHEDRIATNSITETEGHAGKSKKRPQEVLEKAVVLQEARIFHDDKAVKNKPDLILQVLTRLLRLANTRGIRFSQSEATELFFASSKLFLSEDQFVRRMLYLFLKEIYIFCNPDDVIIITSSLTKDMTCDIPNNRANALRVLACIINPSMLGAIERYVKQAIVDSYAPSASAGLVTGIKLSQTLPECTSMVRRWVTEINQAMKRHGGVTQYLALILLYQTKSTDRLAISKIVSQCRNKKVLRCPMAIVMLIRYSTGLIIDEGAAYNGMMLTEASGACGESIDFLLTCLKHKSDLVAIEAARSLSSLPLKAEELYPVISVINVLLTSVKPCVRFAALKTLASIAERFPGISMECKDKLEELTKDNNSTVVTLAVTTLLKLSTEDTIDMVLEKISCTICSMEKEDQVAIIKGIISLQMKFPSRRLTFLLFLEKNLMQKAPYELKKTIVVGIIESVNCRPEASEDSLLILSKSLDTCEHANLVTDILNAISELSRLALDVSPHIPYIYNCFLLGDRSIRAAAVSSLAKICSHHPSMRSSIFVLLKHCVRDEDDETRDRAAAALAILNLAMTENSYDFASHDYSDTTFVKPSDDDVACHIYSPMDFSFSQLERSLQAYILDSDEMGKEELLTFESLPHVEDKAEEQHSMNIASLISKKKKIPAESVYAIPELAALGQIFKSSFPIHSTEDETEYVVQCVKHIYVDMIVLEFKVHNTVENQRLDNVGVVITGCDNDDLYEAVGELRAKSISYGCTDSCFIVLKGNSGTKFSPSVFALELQFTVCSVDEESGEEVGEFFEEEYPLEDIHIVSADFMQGTVVSDFRTCWGKRGKESEAYKNIGLQFNSLQEAISSIVEFLGMYPCDGTEQITMNKPSQMLHLSGTLIGSDSVLCRASLSPQGNIFVLKILVRSESKEISQTILDWIE